MGYRDYLDTLATMRDDSLVALVTCWRRVLAACPERVDWEQRRRIRAWEAELAYRRIEVA